MCGCIGEMKESYVVLYSGLFYHEEAEFFTGVLSHFFSKQQRKISLYVG